MTQVTVVLCVLVVWSLLSVIVGVGAARMLRNRNRQQPARDTKIGRY
jgi:hypothetical protein